MKIKKSNLYATLSAICVLTFSLNIAPLYIDGDQLHYRDFYKYCFYDALTLSQQFFCYQNTLGSQEPGYFFISKLAYLYLEKDIFISISNTILTFFMTLLILKYYQRNWQRLIFIILAITNYYFVVMLLSAERLKFSFIFLIIALLISGNKKIIPFGLAMLTHIQSILLIGPYYLAQVFDKKTNIWIRGLVILGFILLSAALFIFLNDHIESKFTSYSSSTDENGTGIIGVIKTSIFILLAGISVRKIIPIICGMPLIVLSYFLGSERIGMLAFILYVFTVLYYKRKMDVLLFVIMLYFSFKSIGFISNVITYGTGYYFIE